MAGLLSGLEQFGLSNLESMDLYETQKKPEEGGEGGQAAAHVVQEQDFLFDKSFTCPLCDREFHGQICGSPYHRNGKTHGALIAIA